MARGLAHECAVEPAAFRQTRIALGRSRNEQTRRSETEPVAAIHFEVSAAIDPEGDQVVVTGQQERPIGVSLVPAMLE